MEKQIGQEGLTGQVLRPEEAHWAGPTSARGKQCCPGQECGVTVGEKPPAARRKAQAPLHFGELSFLRILQTAPVPVSHWDCAQLGA